MSGNTGSDVESKAIFQMQRRKRRRWLWPLLVMLTVAVAAGVFVGVEAARAVGLGAISPAPGSVISSRSVTISCGLARYSPGTGAVALTVDGKPVPAADLVLGQGMVQVQMALAEGAHSIAVGYDSGNLFSRHLVRSWDFIVDTTPPAVSIVSPESFPMLDTQLNDVRFTFSEPATASLSLDGTGVSLGSADAAGTSAGATLTLGDGRHTLTLTAVDKAGNSTSRDWEVVVDSQAPQIAAEGLPEAAVWKKQTSAAVTLTVTDYFADQVQVAATLDGAPLTVEGPSSSNAASDGGPAQKVFGFDTGTLAEGAHVVEVSATDPGGHVATLKREFVVDTSNVFGARPLILGAQGEDVKQLQRILKIKGVYAGSPSGTLDEATAAAVAAFNSQMQLDGGSTVTTQTLKYLLGYVRIDVSERKLYLYSGDDKLIKVYGVAVGMAAHPTPTGTFRIMTKQKNPTWNPPDSAWAAGMGPVPPGPANPLGTRWMGLNSPGIGIHGTPAPSSIGTAASHGCIRMRIPDAEDLFDRVFVGTPVQIVN